MNTYTRLFVVALPLLVSACTPLFAEKVLATDEVGPVELQTLAAGEMRTITRLKNGEEGSYTIKGVDGGKVFGASLNDDCTWTSLDDPFAPSLEWKNCGNGGEWSSGKTEILAIDGQLWLLQVGNSKSYSFISTSSAGSRSENTRKCNVEAWVEVMAAETPYDAFKVVCAEKSRTRTYYYAPEMKNWVVYIDKNRERQTIDNYELVSIE